MPGQDAGPPASRQETAAVSKVFGYVRCSTDDQADSGLGLEACREAIHQHYEKRYMAAGYTFGGIYEDPSVSGAASSGAARAAAGWSPRSATGTSSSSRSWTAASGTPRTR
jgi:hypothetical protein